MKHSNLIDWYGVSFVSEKQKTENNVMMDIQDSGLFKIQR